jgi:co-chaperonin GroES (HSP10)
MYHEDDPKKEILDRLGDLSGLSVMHNRIVVATSIRPQKTKGGIILTDTAREEDEYQGKVGLVIAMGPLAFKDDEKTKFHGQKIEVGDWVYYHPHDGKQMKIKGVHCRAFAYETQILGKLNHPDAVW